MKPLKRPHKRRTFRGDLAGDRLFAKRGCFVRAVERDGSVRYDEQDKSAVLHANIGDRLLLSHHDVFVDEIANCEVVAVHPGWLEAWTVRVLRGAIAPATRDVWIMQAGKAAA